jgi:hypothetical protein
MKIAQGAGIEQKQRHFFLAFNEMRRPRARLGLQALSLG